MHRFADKVKSRTLSRLLLAIGIFVVGGVVMRTYLLKFSDDNIETESTLLRSDDPSSFIEVPLGSTGVTLPIKSVWTSKSPQLPIQPIIRDRLGIIMYLPKSDQYLYQFLGISYGSWKYLVENRATLLKHKNAKGKKTKTIDLLVFCYPTACKELPPDCTDFPINAYKKDYPWKWSEEELQKIERSDSSCWKVYEPNEVDFPYPVLNSFVMFNRSDISEIRKPYRYFLRTDIDGYFSPSIWYWEPGRSLIVGQGGYCDLFNMERLKQIAKKLGMTHRGVHCTGSTWFGESEFFTLVAKRTIEMTKYMFLNEFDPKLPGLETINFTVNIEGEWIRWWRPVSLLYGGELALNDMVRDINQSIKGPMDASSCSKESIWTYPHIHCWHDPCEFSKFTFMVIMSKIIHAQGEIPAHVGRKIIQYSQFHDARSMTIRDFCTYIAWNSVGRYMQRLLTASDSKERSSAGR